jgi:DDE superfamily endonuclease
MRTIDEVEEYFPGFKAFIDSSEQEIPRPTKNKRRRKRYYSGKKKKHTVKTQYMVNSEGTILYYTKQIINGEECMIMKFSKIIIL